MYVLNLILILSPLHYCDCLYFSITYMSSSVIAICLGDIVQKHTDYMQTIKDLSDTLTRLISCLLIHVEFLQRFTSQFSSSDSR